MHKIGLINLGLKLDGIFAWNAVEPGFGSGHVEFEQH